MIVYSYIWLLYRKMYMCTQFTTKLHTLTSLDFTSWYFTATNFKFCFVSSNSFIFSSNNVSVAILSSRTWVILAFNRSIVYYNITSLQGYHASILPSPSPWQLTVVVRSASTHHHMQVPGVVINYHFSYIFRHLMTHVISTRDIRIIVVQCKYHELFVWGWNANFKFIQ